MKKLKSVEEVVINIAMAKELLGYREAKKGEIPHMVHDGKKVYFDNNMSNRPLRPALAERYAEDIVTQRWAGMANSPSKTVNGETIIIDTKSQIVSGAHRLAGLLKAEEKRRENPTYYREQWDANGPLKFPALLAIGTDPISADTVDQGQKRSAADVLYRQDGMFEELSDSKRKKLTSWLAVAARLCWLRMGGLQVSDAPHFPHSEMLEFINEHPRLVSATKVMADIEAESRGGFATLKISQGYMIGLMYLAMHTLTDPDNEDEVEKLTHWVETIATGEGIKRGEAAFELRLLYTKQLQQDGSRDRDTQIIGPWIKAWKSFQNGNKTTMGRLKLKKDEIPILEGIDYVDSTETTEE